MFRTIADLVPWDRDYPDRTHTLDVFRRTLDGTLYDVLANSFHQERNSAGEYIPIAQRRPSVRKNICLRVVRDSVSLLFGEGRFPTLGCDDKPTRAALVDLVKDTSLNGVMIEAARRGSIGSVAVRFRVLKGRPFFDVMDTLYLTPTWKLDAPDTLAQVDEAYKVRGDLLETAGYAGLDAATTYWFRRRWTETQEIWFKPQSLTDASNKLPIVIDATRTVTHALGFVPLSWIRNLPGGDAIDGACTFAPGAETAVEIDYQLSQAGRGLKYSSDPTLLIKEPAAMDGQFVKSASNALVVSEKGDAKMLEINGTASSAVIEYAAHLEDSALAAMRGNRGNPDKLSAAQSGRALELLHQPLVWLADDLRVSYGDALLDLVSMAMRAHAKYPLTVRAQPLVLNVTAPVSLEWRPWFPPTYEDKQAEAVTLKTHREAGNMSRETAVRSMAPTFDIEDVPAEIARIMADETAQDAREKALAAQVQVKATGEG